MLPLFMPQLPDGNEIQVGVDRFKVPELLFQPVSMLKSCWVEVWHSSVPARLQRCSIHCWVQRKTHTDGNKPARQRFSKLQ